MWPCKLQHCRAVRESNTAWITKSLSLYSVFICLSKVIRIQIGTNGVFLVSLIDKFLSVWLSRSSFFKHFPLPRMKFLSTRTTRTGGEMAGCYLSRESQSASCIIMRKDISIHKGSFLSHLSLSLAEYFHPDWVFLTIPSGVVFPTPPFYHKHLHKSSVQNNPICRPYT